MTWAVKFEGVTKQYRGGGARYPSLRHDLAAGLQRAGERLRGRRAEARGSLALDDVSFEVPEGGSFAVIGPNGAGKTTALKIISRITYPTGGRVRVRGRVGALIEVGSGVHPELNARENIWLYGQILGMGRKEIRSRFDEIVEFAELADVLDRPVKMFSSGMQLRLGFAIASHLDPDVFVVDEALAVGDAGFQVKCVERMRKLVASGRTLLFVSHTLPVVREICDRAILLDRGEIVGIGTAVDVIEQYMHRLQERQLGRSSASGERIEVRGVRVLPVAGPKRLVTGDQVVIELDLLVGADTDNVALGLALSTGGRGNLVTMSMLSDRDCVTLAAGNATVRCSLAPLPLLPGEYEIWFSAVPLEGGTEYASPKPIGVLLIAQGPASRGGDMFFATGGGYGPVHVPFKFALAEPVDLEMPRI